MARDFRFRLEPVRQLRERAEDDAKEDLAAAMAERRRWAQRRAAADEKLDGARSAHRDAATTAGSIASMAAHQAFLERTEREARAAELDEQRQEAEVAARRAALEQAARERQVLEKLRTKQERAHRDAARRAEAAMLDDLATTGHHRRRTAGA